MERLPSPDLSVQNIHILSVGKKPIALVVVQLAHDAYFFQVRQGLVHRGHSQACLFGKPGRGDYGPFLQGGMHMRGGRRGPAKPAYAIRVPEENFRQFLD